MLIYHDLMRPSFPVFVTVVDYVAHLVRVRTLGGDTFCVNRRDLTIAS